MPIWHFKWQWNRKWLWRQTYAIVCIYRAKITADALFGAGRKINALGFPAAAVIVIVRGKDQMASNFPGNRGRALAKFVRNPFEAPSFFDASLDRDSVRECKVFAFVGFNKSIHK